MLPRCPGCFLPSRHFLYTPTHPTGKYIENHGVVHNMFYNTSSKVKLPYHATLGIQRWWDNGSLPIWITAQRQVMLHPHPLGQTGEVGGGPSQRGHDHVTSMAGPVPALGVRHSRHRGVLSAVPRDVGAHEDPPAATQPAQSSLEPWDPEGLFHPPDRRENWTSVLVGRGPRRK